MHLAQISAAVSRAAGERGGVRPSPNIWHTPDVYELENQAFDRADQVGAAIDALHPLAGATLLDIGCGTGYHLPGFADRGARVLGLEPHPPLARLAAARLADRPESSARQGPSSAPEPAPRPPAPSPDVARRAGVLTGEAEHLPLANATVDVAVARWAYFFGPGCEPGLAEVERVLRPGGLAAFLDNDATRSRFGGWFAASLPAYDPIAVRRFWRRQGFTALDLDLAWECPDRATFEAIVRIEFAPALADRILATHPGTSVDYAVTLWHRTH